MSKNKIDEKELATLNEAFPVVESTNRLLLPRFGMLSKDIVAESGSGKSKKIKVVEASGTFFTEVGNGDDMEKTFLEGEEKDIIIVFHRKQLKYYDKGLEQFISSPVFDTDEQIIPLYLDKRVIARGTRQELQDLYPALTQKGKKTSDLKEHKVLYVIFEDTFYQMSLSISSGWSFGKYAQTFRDGQSPATVVTSVGSTEETAGSNTYRKMDFNSKRAITASELELVKENQLLIKEVSKSTQEFYLSESTKSIESADEKLKNF